MSDIPKRLFVAGTDTDVGKTLVSAILMAGLGAFYWKPVQSGAACGTDTEWIKEKTGFPDHCFFPETYRLKGYLSPHQAALLEGVAIDLKKIDLPFVDSTRHLIVEGAGGLMVPLNDRWLVLDLVQQLGIPVLLVAKSGLGTINHTLLSLEILKSRSIEVFGVVMNGSRDEENRKAIEHFGNVRVVAEVEPLPVITADTLVEAYEKYFR